jgi:hypothetical protein
MYDLFNRLESARKQLIAKRQMEILNLLLDRDQLEFEELARTLAGLYNSLGNPRKAFLRDITLLINLGAIKAEELENDRIQISIDLTWPLIMTEAAFFERMGQTPRSRTYPFLS